jgi:NAD(P)H-flavin reductase/formate hydrogenlyase subunit 6/NADH:ubiquinone oxidoreductase subunit I
MVNSNATLAVDQKPQARKTVVISKKSFKSMVEHLLKHIEVVGVKSKQAKFVYDRISTFDELCMDYSVTIISPTKYLLPARETILKLTAGDNPKTAPVLENTPRVIIGVHPYDIRAIELLDVVFMATNPDPNYIARRQNTLIIGVDCLHPSNRNFSPCMGTNVAEHGFDLLLTDIGNSYVVTVGSQKGLEILKKHADIGEVTNNDIAKRQLARDEALAKCDNKLNCPKERIPKLLEENYDDVYWEKRSSTCLSCGSCVMVCPTCFCFDVQDDMALNLKDGERIRQWDGCMLVDFAKVATGENFRHDKTSRFRHRIFRKGKYVLERFGKMGCVGCGRCTTACLAEIASPIEAFNAIDESYQTKQAAIRSLRETSLGNELYAPRPAEIVRVETLGPKEKVFEFKFFDDKELGHRPGQFVEVSVLGLGEAPISITSSPTRTGSFELAIRNVGSITNALHKMEKGAIVGFRGPFGNGFPINAMMGKDILFIAGGIGLFPLRSLIQYVMDKRSSFGKVMLLLGATSPSVRMFVTETESWKNTPDLECHETVDRCDNTWTGNVGVITTLIPKVQFDPRKTMAVIVGPPIMYRFVINELKKRDMADENIVMSLERRMKCGVGKCGHCQINGVYVCQEGPVFTLAQLRTLREAV